MARRSYQGSCHCGAVRFRFASEELTSGRRCNCSICVRKSTVMSPQYVAPEDFELLSGREALALYRWGDSVVNHWFCRTCGIHPFHDVTATPGRYRVNLGCVEGIDVLALPIEILDGRSL